jgi:glycosyltransferase involved in cell wall biosynthesis
MPSSPAAGQPLLTIAVPTYNRAANLENLLTVLQVELGSLPQIELIVSDNASPDGTEAVVRRFLAEGLRCRYLRNETNIGADANFLQCYEAARGRYLWIFGDDDIIFPGALARICELLATQEVSMMYLSPFGFERDPDERGLRNVRPAVRVFEDAGEFVHSVNLRGDFALITASIVNKEQVEAQAHGDFREGLETHLVQLGWVFTALRHFRRGLMVDRGLYAVCEFNPQRNFDIIRVFGPNWVRAAGIFLDRGSALHRRVLFEQLYGWFVTNWYGMRRKPHLTRIVEPERQMRGAFGGNPVYWVIAWPLVAWPMLPAGGWLLLWRTVRRVDRWVTLLRHPRTNL